MTRPTNRPLLAVDVARLQMRYPAAFKRSWMARAIPGALAACAGGLALYALWRFDFSPLKLIDGMGKEPEKIVHSLEVSGIDERPSLAPNHNEACMS